MRWLVLVVAACAAQSPTQLNAGPTGFSLERGPDDTFGALTATANGIDCGAPMVIPGKRGGRDTPDTNATASFALPAAALVGDTLALVVDEGTTRFAMNFATLAAPRAVTLAAALDQPLRPDDWVEATTGVATDRLEGNGISGSIAGNQCFYLPAAARDLGASMRVQMPPTLDGAWMPACGMPQPPGTLVDITLVLGLAPWIPPTRCDGPALSCGGFALPIIATSMPATIQM